MVLNAGRLNRRIQLQRMAKTPDGGGGYSIEWQNLGDPIHASRQDVSDAERVLGGVWTGRLVTRFVIRASDFARGIKRSDRLVHEGIAFEIDGIKEVPPGRAFFEITAQAENT